MKVKIFYLENMGAERFEKVLWLVLYKGGGTHRVYIKYDTRGVIRYLLGYM